MWFADVALPLSWALLIGWLVLIALWAGTSRIRTLLPRPLPLLAGFGASAALVTAQAAVVDRVEDLGAPGPLDRSVLAWALTHRSGPATTAMKAVSSFGSTAVMAGLAVLVAVLLWRAHHRAIAGTVLAAALGAGVLVEAFKHLYQRSRPPAVDRLVSESSFSLPSGHALGSLVVLGMLATATVLLARGRGKKIGAVVLATIATIAIGFSRVYLGVHWASDVLTGWLLGGAWLAACVSALVLLTAPPRRVAAAGRSSETT